MKLRDPRHFGQWCFYIGGKEESDNPDQEIETLRIPQVGYLNSKRNLEIAVLNEIGNLAQQGVTGYLISLQEEAKSYGKTIQEFIGVLIEHQICVRSQNKNQLCWATGLGDKIHSVTENVDDLMAKAPEPAKKIWKKIVKVATPKASNPQRLSSCRSCGGGRSLKVSRNNRGRSGRI